MTEKINDFFTDVLVNLIYFDKNFEYEPGVRDDIDTPHSRQKQWWQNYLSYVGKININIMYVINTLQF